MAVHVDLVNSPYTQPPIAPHPPSHPGKRIIQENKRQLEESKRLQEFGQASKESWITRLYTHVMDKQDENSKEEVWAHKTGFKTERSFTVEESSSSAQKSTKPGQLPPLHRSTRNPNKNSGSIQRSREFHSSIHHNREYHSIRGISKEKDNSVSRPSTAGDTPQNTEPIMKNQLSYNTSNKTKDKHLKPLPAELAFSPYLPERERSSYKIIVNERIKELAKAKRAFNSREREKSGRREKRENKIREPQSWLTTRQTHPYATNYVSAYAQYGNYGNIGRNGEYWRTSYPKAYSIAEMEKKAKDAAEKSMKVSTLEQISSLTNCNSQSRYPDFAKLDNVTFEFFLIKYYRIYKICRTCRILFLVIIFFKTRMHSSRMRTVRCSSRNCLPGGCLARGCLPRGCLAGGVFAQGGVGVCPGGCLPGGACARHPPVNRMTDTCENITLPQLHCVQ